MNEETIKKILIWLIKSQMQVEEWHLKGFRYDSLAKNSHYLDAFPKLQGTGNWMALKRISEIHGFPKDLKTSDLKDLLEWLKSE